MQNQLGVPTVTRDSADEYDGHDCHHPCSIGDCSRLFTQENVADVRAWFDSAETPVYGAMFSVSSTLDTVSATYN